MGKKHPHISDGTFGDYLDERDRKEPGYKARVDALADQHAIARRVRSLREKRKLSQAELASLAGTGQASIARIESGRFIPKLDLLSRVAGALGAQLKIEISVSRS